jgi:glycosyltransferase involved in cell wall biosynthesis
MPATAPITYRRAGVVIPAHNERSELPACLGSALTAALCAPLPVTLVVVLDASDDGSADLAGRFGSDVQFISVDERNVGAARAAGFRYLRTLRECDTECWYATTDADTRVDPDWLVRQLARPADMVLGVVRVDNWRHHGQDVVDRYLRAYNARGGGHHDHVHGANMGFSASAYWSVGGFRALATGEDVDLVRRFEAAGCQVRRDGALSVTTSARRRSRAPRGFSHYLRQLTRSGRGDCA